jgi:dipeptidyl aminopeptidase/acylaminoacyl peptidase
MSVGRLVLALGALPLLLSSPARAQEKRPVTFEDVLALKTVSSPVLSPDGAHVVYVVTGWEEGDSDGKKESVSHLFRVGVSGGEPVPLTFGKKGESAPSYSPDGKWISFLAARGDSEKKQIFLLPSAGGEAFRLTDAKEGVSSYAWSPDSGTIAFTSREALAEEDETKDKRRDDPAVYEGDIRFTHLWTIDVSSKQAVRRTEGTSFTVKETPSWSPDGGAVAFTAAPTPWLRDERDDVYVLILEGNGVERLTSNLGPDNAPRFSPDGAYLAFLTTPNDSAPLPDGTQTPDLRNARLALYELAAKRIRDLSSSSFDLIPGAPAWWPDGKRILFTAGDRAYQEVFAYDLGSGRYTKLTRGAFASPPTMSRDGSKVALTLESSSAPADVHVSGPDFREPRRLTRVNPQAADFSLGESELLTWKSTEGYEVEGVLLKPVGYEPGKKYPLLVVAHGGPTGAHFDYFRVRYGDGGQHWAGQGWAVLYPNPRGSTNYGEAFMRGNLADWGGGDYRDIIAGVDALVARGIADPERLAFQGWSYGGYLTCWTISQTTRFKAAMIGAGLTNLVSMYGTNDVPNYLGAFFNGTLSPETEHLYRERSGLTYADRVTTPTLILHGGSDERVPIGQPMEFFRALKDRGVPVELVFYPREGHGLQEYYHRLDRMERQFEWITRHTLGAAPATNEP